MVRAAVAGIAGRMGSRIAQLIGETDGIELAAGFEHPDHPKVGKDVSEAVGGAPAGWNIAGTIQDALDKADVVIDFTSAATSLTH
ncbi:MAG: 4-hydroxy-tetrahydrodipicolinate reductase, partial [Desulforhabdus sp.]|nr:4-hydroxy-tetrahydrodipicolinate reductase [Desulforhabdus sp.]